MPGDPRMRASDTDRDRAASLLREHHAEGRLTAEEFHDRVRQIIQRGHAEAGEQPDRPFRPSPETAGERRTSSAARIID